VVTRILLEPFCIKSNIFLLPAAELFKVKVKVTFQLKVSQSVCLGVEPALGLMTRYYFLSEGFFLKVAVLSLWGALSDKKTGL
jgi:hypothetical protein